MKLDLCLKTIVVICVIATVVEINASSGSCGLGHYCGVQQWAPWSNCNATCGVTGMIRREKYFCCDTKKYHTLDQCLKGCNITSKWWQTNSVQTRTCGHCKQGGTFNSLQNVCECRHGYGGICCKVKTTQSPLTKTTTAIKITTTFTTQTTTTQKLTTTTRKPSSTSTKPTSATTKSTTATQKPKIAAPKPTTSTINPTRATAKTKTTSPKPTTSTTKPTTTTPKPTTKDSKTTTSIQPYSFQIATGSDCTVTLCQNGVCVTDSKNQKICSCEDGYKGNFCEINTDDCASDPCLYGTCMDKVDNIQCECLKFFDGKRCSKVKTWAIAFLGLLILSLLACCCWCCWCIFSKRDREGEDNKVKPIETHRPLPASKANYNSWL